MKPSQQLMARKETIQRLRPKVPLPIQSKNSPKKRPQTQKIQRDHNEHLILNKIAYLLIFLKLQFAYIWSIIFLQAITTRKLKMFD